MWGWFSPKSRETEGGLIVKMNSKRIILGAAMLTAVSCSKKKEEAATTPTASSVADLKLSTALAVDIPESLATASGGTALSLAAGKKSSEACRVMENTNRVFENLSTIKGMFCHLEIESAQMKFGTKYNVSILGDAGLEGQSMSIWVDNSDAAALKVYMCESGSLKEQFTVTGFGGEGKVKGTLASIHSNTEGSSVSSGGINMEFDFTTAGVKILKSSSSHTSTGGDHAGSYRSASDIYIVDTGLSAIKMSNKGTRGTDTMNDQGAVLFNGTMGQALFTGSGTYSGNTYDFTSRSTFDKEGVAVSKADATADVVVDKSTLPEKLADSFTPTSPAGWDCSGATETVTIDMTEASKKAAHDACNNDRGHSFSNCWGDGFEYGEHE